MTDLVVDLGETRSATVRDALAQALGDPTLAVAYRVDGGYVDAVGRPTNLPPTGTGRQVTRIERDGARGRGPRPRHRGAGRSRVAPGCRGRDAARRGKRAPAGRGANPGHRARSLAPSAARGRGRRAPTPGGATARRCCATVDAPGPAADEGPHHGECRDSAGDRASGTATRENRERPARAGRRAAPARPRRARAAGCDFGTREAERDARRALPWTSGRLPEHIEATVFLVCSEALANVAKHADASEVAIRVVDAGQTVVVYVVDDGVGRCGAARRSPTGSRRSAARSKSRVRPASGTRLRAEIPR